MFQTDYLDYWWIILQFDYYFTILNNQNNQNKQNNQDNILAYFVFLIILAYSDYSCIFCTDISASRYFASLARSYGPWSHSSVQVSAHRQLKFSWRSTHSKISKLAICWKEIGIFESAGSGLHPTARNTRGYELGDDL